MARQFYLGIFAVAANIGLVVPESVPSQRQFLNGVSIDELNQKSWPVFGEITDRLAGVVHYRLVPYEFPSGMRYHFDGLAAVLRFEFTDSSLAITAEPYQSRLQQHYDRCIFYGSGTGPTPGLLPCTRNPVVNLLPINDQLWLTIDTHDWGRVNKSTLATIHSNADVPTLILNAHPACDRSTGECFVQHPCPLKNPDLPVTDQACFSTLRTSPTRITTESRGRATMPHSKTIQHSHSPCITPHYVIAKLDSFQKFRDTDTTDRGLLRQLRQAEASDWLVMNRDTNETTVLQSNFSFVNNHFWNCYEDPNGKIVVDTVAATKDYLHTYFNDSLYSPTQWDAMFFSPHRCTIDPSRPSDDIGCSPLFKDSDFVFDYPTFNPLFKMNPEYRWFYGISPASNKSQWFDTLFKADAQNRNVVRSWHEPGVFVTEGDFVPTGQDEDDGLLLSVIFNSTSDESSLAVFDARNLALLQTFPFGHGVVIPFHAHGIVCTPGNNNRCFSNP